MSSVPEVQPAGWLKHASFLPGLAKPPHQQEARVSQTEGPRPADASAAVHHDGAVLRAEGA